MIVLMPDPGVEFTLEDPDGQVKALLDHLDGPQTVESIATSLATRWPNLTADDVARGVLMLDEARLVEDAAANTRLSRKQQERYFSNLAFFGTFSSLRTSRFSFQERLLRSRVLLLGVGGLGSMLLYNLAGLGVRRITLLDHDRVELKNFARQFLYSESDIGHSKVERAAARARAFNSELETSTVERRISSPEDLQDLVSDVDLVLVAVDQPADVRSWANDACVRAGVPHVGGGFLRNRGMFWSVDPGRSACQACHRIAAARGGAPTYESPEPLNRGIAPVASLVGSLVALEGLRYLTRFAEPISAGRLWLVDFATGQLEVAQEWIRLANCPVCHSTSAERQPPTATVSAT
jgi:molybdopterin/thiamine biosynthesis adenylyltransferase